MEEDLLLHQDDQSPSVRKRPDRTPRMPASPGSGPASEAFSTSALWGSAATWLDTAWVRGEERLNGLPEDGATAGPVRWGVYGLGRRCRPRPVRTSGPRGAPLRRQGLRGDGRVLADPSRARWLRAQVLRARDRCLPRDRSGHGGHRSTGRLQRRSEVCRLACAVSLTRGPFEIPAAASQSAAGGTTPAYVIPPRDERTHDGGAIPPSAYRQWTGHPSPRRNPGHRRHEHHPAVVAGRRPTRAFLIDEQQEHLQ